MGLFSNSFRNIIPTKIGNVKQVLSTSSAQTVLSSINRYRSHLSYSQGPQDSLFSAVSLDPDLISDQFIERATVSYDEDHPDVVQISDDISEAFIEGFSEAVHNGESSIIKEGVTITDGQGRIYNVIDQRSEDLVFDNKKIMFSSTVFPNKIAEAIVYEDLNDNKIYFNNFIRSADFVSAAAQRITPTTCDDAVLSMCVISSLPVSVHSSMYENLGALGASGSTILDRIQSLCTRHHVTYTGVMFTDLIALYHWYNVSYPLQVGKGRISPIWSVIKDNVESSQLNNFILNTCDSILGGMNVATAISSLVTESCSSKWNSIRKFGKGVASAFNRGGVYGVACYILSYIKELVTAEEDDGTFKFTDNSKFAPKVYLAGLLKTIATAVGTVLTVIVSIFSRIIGAAIGIITFVISSIFKAFTYDYSASYAALNTDDNVIIPIAPYGLLQCEFDISLLTNKDYLCLIEQGESLVYCEVPGGYILLGPGSFNDDGTVKTIRCEAHPSIIYSRGCAGLVIADLNAHGLIEVHGHEEEGEVVTNDQINIFLKYQSPANARATCDRIAYLWNQSVTNLVLENQDNDRLSESDDAFVRDIICQNLFILGVYLGYLGGRDWINDELNNNLLVQPVQRNVECDDHLNCGIWYALTKYGPTFTVEYDGVGGETQIAKFNYVETHEYDWKGLYDNVIITFETSHIFDISLLINEAYYFDELTTYNSKLEYALFLPKYDRKSFWMMMIATLVVTALVATAIAVTTIKVRKKILQKRAVNEARVAAAYDALQHDPSQENYKAYRKAVKKNNLWATFIGGSKFDVESYWHGATNVDGGATSGSDLNPLALADLIPTDTEITSTSQDMLSAVDSDQTASNSSEIIRLIVGIPQSS